MIGTSFEMLYYLSNIHDVRINLCASRKRMNKLREQIVRQSIDEDEVIGMLEHLDCKMIRPKYILPAIIEDRYGKKYNERSFVKGCCTDEEKKSIRFLSSTSQLVKNDDRLKELVKQKRGKFIEHRLTTPSVWSYEPEVETWSSTQSNIVHRILGL